MVIRVYEYERFVNLPSMHKKEKKKMQQQEMSFTQPKLQCKDFHY